MAEDERFLDRWSRRKTDVKDETTASTALEPMPDGGEVTAPEDGAGEGKAPAFDPKDLPDIDSLDAESDFSVFMREGVPDQIRTLAMRKLWRLDPVFANLDGLVDYGEDFTLSDRPLDAIRTVYKVGKGMVGDDEEPASEAGEDVADSEAEQETPPTDIEDAASEPVTPDEGDEPNEGTG